MKKIVFALLIIMLTCLLVVSLSGCDRGEDVCAELEFQLFKDQGGYYVVGASGGNTVVVPEYHQGRPIVGISMPATASDIDKFVISKNIKDIQPGSFVTYKNHVEVRIDKNNPFYYVKDQSVIDSRTNELVHSFAKWFRIPSEVTSIGEGAFSFNTNLRTVIIPSRIKSIGEGAFQYCSNLKFVAIGKGVETIGLGAFFECDSLETCSIPASVVQLSSLFYGCDKIVEIKIDKDNPRYYIDGNCIIDKTQNQLAATFGMDVVIPDGVESMAPMSLMSTARSLYIPASLKLENSMFRYCDKLNSLTFGEGVSTIEYRVMFGGSSTLQKVVIPSSVIEIGERAFKNYIALTEVVFMPNSRLKLIGEYAFYGCESLKKVTLPSSLMKIGKDAFWYCHSLSEVIFEDVETWYGTDDNGSWHSCLFGTQLDVTDPRKNAELFVTSQSTSDGWSYFYKC